MQMKNIVILGAGFGGLRLAMGLSKVYKNDANVSVILIDKNRYHLFYPNLYEVATSPEEITDLEQLAATVGVPIEQVLKKTNVKFVQAEVKKIDGKLKEVYLSHGSIGYDYLVSAFGSTGNFFGIKGADQYALPFKSLHDALKIRNNLEFMVQSHRLDVTKLALRVIVVGGGFAGVELAAELSGYLNFLCWKNNFPRQKIELYVVEGANRLLPGLADQVGKDAYNRLHNLDVRIELNSILTSVEPKFINFATTERMEYDCLIWAAGVRGCDAPMEEHVECDRANRVMVSESLQLPTDPNIFFLGDQALITDKKTGRPVPGTAQYAMHQAEYLTYAIPQVMENKKPSPYNPRSFGYIIPLGGKYALFVGTYFYIIGFLAYVLRIGADLRYFAKVLGIFKAIRLVFSQVKIYSKND